MTRLSDTEALKSQGLKEAGNEFASEKDPFWGEGASPSPAYQSADYAVDANKRKAEREAQMRSPTPYCFPSQRTEGSRKTGAGNSQLSAAVRICKE